MRNFVVILFALPLASLPASFALSYGHANAFGGSTSHSWGAPGHGNSAGGGTSRSPYASTFPAAYGGTTARPVGYAYRPPGGAHAYGYHPPTAVGYYGAGCYNCGGSPVAVAVAGAYGAAAIASKVYAEGYNAGVSNEVVAPAPSYALGLNMAALPEDCLTTVVHGGTYYLCGNSWFSPFYGASGVYYRVVPTP